MIIMAEWIEFFAILAIPIAFLASPVIALICGIVRVLKYNDAKLQKVINPDSYTDEDINDLKKSVIATFITSLVLAIIVIAIILLFTQEITYM